jgi:NDP-4-keto-2,6-dideoxyhexose 3-C-methyltransferase
MEKMVVQNKRIACISCGTAIADDIVIIGEQYPSAVFISDKNPVMSGLTASSLNLTRCTNESCGLVQLANMYDLQYVFDHYPYESGSTATMKQILQDVVDDAKQIIPLSDDDVVLDIGGNDGTLLGLIRQPVRARVNIDAAAGVVQSVSDADYKHIHARFNADVYHELSLPKPRLIFSVAMFYHLNDPLDFCRSICDVMSDDSVWVLQMTYLGTMLRDNIFDNIVHEHAAYYSLSSLEYLLAQVGLHIAEARLVKSYGGSLRVFIVKDPARFPKKYWRKDYVDIQRFEIDNKTNTYEALYAFNSRTQLLRDSIGAIVDHLVQRNGPLWGFGASTKGNMILQYLGINTDRMSVILDNSPKKIGTWTTGSMIPIVEEASHLDSLPEYLFVLPYYYTNAFVKIIKKHLTIGREVHLLVPLPYPHFITVQS